VQVQSLDRRVGVVLGWMEENLGMSVSPEAMAETVNISTSRLRHLFKEQTGNTPLHQLKLMRLQRARVLLQSSFLTLKQVMGRVGITDISHFVKDYKTMYGETPGQTRTSYHANQPITSRAGQRLAILANRYDLISPKYARTVR
jgi:transcriptional regulator GlxA family with amidase domain